MLLQRLVEYADRQLKLPPTLYAEAPVRYIVELDRDGRLLNPRPIDTSDPASPRTRRGERRWAPQIGRTVAVQPLLLCDNAEYTFGLARDASKPERVAACHAAYLDLLARCAEATCEPAVLAVQRFLRADPVRQLDLDPAFDRGATVTFRVEGSFPIDLPAVQTFWASEHAPAEAEAGGHVMQCLTCGQVRSVLPRLQAKLKGVPGGQTSGTALISANANAFESYGLEASLIAPTCATCGERFTQAANALLSSRANRLIVGGAAFLFWTRDDVGFDFLRYLDQPSPEDVRSLLESPRTGRQAADLDATAFYATSLSGSGGRAVVRDWIDTTVGEAQVNLALWFRRQAIVDPSGAVAPPLGLYPLAAATVRDANKDLVPPTPRALLRGALTGAPLPLWLLFRAVQRIQAEGTVRRTQAALIKLVWLSQPGHGEQEEERMIRLDPEHPNAAYHCGRLLAVLEEAQRQAIGVATIVERFYGAASSAPASVFGRLLRGVQPHLAKLERDRPGAYRGLQARLEAIQGQLRGFPRTLTLEDQGLFALGYYHQRAHDRAQAIEAAARRRADSAAQVDKPSA